MKKFGLGLGTEIALRLAFIMLAGMLLVAVGTLKMTENNMVRQEADHKTLLLSHIAASIKHFCDAPPFLKKADRLNCFLKSHLDLGFEFIALMGPEQRLIAEAKSNRSPLPCFPREQFQKPVNWSFCKPVKSESSFFHPFEAEILLGVPVFKGTDQIGILYAKSTVNNPHQNISSLYRMTFVYVLFDAILLFFLGWYLLSKKIVRPVKDLTFLVDATGHEFLGYVNHSGERNDIGKLHNAFRRMSDHIKEQGQKVREYVSSLEQTNAALTDTREEVIRSEKLASIGRLAAGISHEIGNPLAAIIGYVELLLQGGFSKDQERDFLLRMESELHRIDEIIRDFLDFSRSSPVQVEGVSLSAAVNSSLHLLSHQKLMRYVTTHLDLEPNLPLVQANAQRLRQVLLNIVVNAADAMPMGGELKITSKLKAGGKGDERNCVVLEIEDSGTGIPPEALPKVFEPFFTTKPPGEGTGLGLPISLRIMESFGGKITVESTVGKGTKFSLIFKRWAGSSCL